MVYYSFTHMTCNFMLFRVHEGFISARFLHVFVLESYAQDLFEISWDVLHI